jgi:hypothetical protein
MHKTVVGLAAAAAIIAAGSPLSASAGYGHHEASSCFEDQILGSIKVRYPAPGAR